MKNKLKLILWGKNLNIPMNFDNLDFNTYKLEYIYKQYKLSLYKNNIIIKKFTFYKNGNVFNQYNFINGKIDGMQYWWRENGELVSMWEYNFYKI